MNNNPSEEELNEDENELNDENDFEGEIVEEHLSSGERGRRRKKVKIRKRVKIKRKATPKKRVKKTFETLIWIIVVVAFITTLIILVVQLDLNPKSKKSRSSSMNTVPENVLQHSNSFTNDKHFLL